MFTPERILLWAPWMVLFMPLFGFIVLALLGGLAKKQGKQHGMMVIATSCVFVSLLLAAATVRSLLALPAGSRRAALRPAHPASQLDRRRRVSSSP